MKRVICFALVTLLAATGVLPQSQQVDFTVRFFDKTIYEPGTPVRLKLMLRNDSGSTYRFRLAENRAFNLNFQVLTSTNTAVPQADSLIRERTTSRRVFYRELILQPGEEFAFVVDLNDFVQLPGPGLYVVTAQFFPNLYSPESAEQLASNRLTLSVRPQSDTVEGVMQEVEQQTRSELEQQAIPPDEVVEYTVRARQRGQWNRFFLYLDLESLLRASPDRERRYIRLSEDEQQQALEQFRQELRAERLEEAILVIPDDFEMVRTSYTQNQAEVVVDMRFEYDDYTEIRRYTYRLERRNSVWLITNYDVTNLGTEAP